MQQPNEKCANCGRGWAHHHAGGKCYYHVEPPMGPKPAVFCTCKKFVHLGDA